MKKGALWIIACLCLSMAANAQQEPRGIGLNKALDEIASELVDKLNEKLPTGAMLSVADIGFRLDGDSRIIECEPLSSNLKSRLANRLIDLTEDREGVSFTDEGEGVSFTDEGEGVSLIRPPPGLSPDGTLVGYWDRIDDESADIIFEFGNTQDPNLTRILDIESRTLFLADLNRRQRKCVFDIVSGPKKTSVTKTTKARIVPGPNRFRDPIKIADPEEELTVLGIAEVDGEEGNRWAIVPVDRPPYKFGFVDCAFLESCEGGISPLLVGAGVAALAGGALALGGGGGGTDPESACPNFLGRDQIAVDFDGEGGPGILTFTIVRIDNNIGIETYIQIDTDDAAIGSDEIFVPFNDERSFDIDISRPLTSLFFTYQRVDPADAANTNFEMQVAFDTTRLISFRGDSISNVPLGQPSNVAEKTICLEFATE